MFVTVAICTFNRAESLRSTLTSLAEMRVPPGLRWEVVVVNNNSGDHTDAVIDAFANRLPIRREFEEKPGASNARNRAVQAAKGDYFVWTDDDVVVDQGWLAAYVAAFARHPDGAVFGGIIRPKYEQPVVNWVAESEALLGAPYCIRDLGNEPVRLSVAGYRLPLGANFAVRGAEQRAFLFDPNLGPGPGTQRRGEEHDVIERILQSGAVGYWVPEAHVQHCIGHERQSISYLMRYFAGAGEADGFLGRHNGPRLLGAPRWLWRGLIQGFLQYHLHRRVSAAPVWVAHLKTYAYARGAIRYAMSRSS